MRCSVLLPLALALSASASLVLPLAASAGSQITRRQTSSCTDECGPVEDEVNACGTDLTCLCTRSVARGLQECAACELESDPTSAQTLQTALDQYASGCEASGNSVGSLTLTATGAASSTSSVASASITSASPATTSTSAPPAFATVTSSSAVASASSSASAAGPSGGLTGSGNGASGVSVQMTGAFVAAGIAAVVAVL